MRVLPHLENEFHFQYPPPCDFEIEFQFHIQVEGGYTVPSPTMWDLVLQSTL